ncbi:MAG: dihydrodipicolinate reductase [Acidobacteriota bacterium]|nr:dihydrodipicolinate reductase [Acidobacteriota bacterium]
MGEKIRVVQVGCGLMGPILLGYLQEKGAEIAAVIDRNPARCGKKVDEVLSLQKPTGLTFEHPDKAEEIFRASNADVVIMATRTKMSDMADIMRTAAKCGINCITLGEEAFYPWNTSPEITRELDELAKAGNCTITGTGFQEIFCGYLVLAACASVQRVDRLEGLLLYNVDHYGSALIEHHGVGLDMDTFNEKITSTTSEIPEEPSYAWAYNEWICSNLGLTITSMTQSFKPVTQEVAVTSKTLELEIPAGQPAGLEARVITETKEGLTIDSRCVGKLFTESEDDLTEWRVVGEPNTTVSVPKPGTPFHSCASLINRIPDLIEAPAGFRTTETLGMAKYWIPGH